MSRGRSQVSPFVRTIPGLVVLLAAAALPVGAVARPSAAVPSPARLECATAGVGIAADRVAVRSGRWGDPRTWGGAVPGAGEVAEVPAGVAVELDVATASLGGLLIRGSLTFADRPLALTSAYVLVAGPGAAFRIGTAARPYAHRAVITLTGAETDASVHGAGAMAMGTKFLGSDAGGAIAIHGHRRDAVAFTRLAGGVSPGDREVILAEAVDWRPGDRVVVTPGHFLAWEAEEREIAAVLDGGHRVRFTEPLRHARYGALQRYRHLGREVVVDERAHVALLTRDIVIQGDAASLRETRTRDYNGPGEDYVFAYRRGFGAHVMSMAGGSLRIEGAELRRVGQTGHQGRYALHYHHGGDRAGDYVRGNSIHHSFQRGVVLHQTSGVEASDNVGYHVVNHIFVANEDGTPNERGNVMRHNIGVLAINPTEDDLAFPNANDSNDSDQDGERASAFWASGTNATYVDNVAAGVLRGQGFFFDNLPYRDRHQPVELTFRGNVAYACGKFRSSLFNYAPSSTGHGLFVRGGAVPDTARAVFREFTAFKNGNAGAWIEGEGTYLEGLTLADNFMGVMSVNDLHVSDALIVGQSANTLGADLMLQNDYRGRGGAIHVVAVGPHEKVLDVRDVTVVDQFGGALLLGTNVERGRVAGAEVVGNRPVYFLRSGEEWYLDDVDGSLTGNAGGVRVAAPASPLVDRTAHYLPGTGGGYALPLGRAPVTIGLPLAEYPLIEDFDRNGYGGHGWSDAWVDEADRGRFNQRASAEPITGRDYAFGEARPGYQWLELYGKTSAAERPYREGSLAGARAARLSLSYRAKRFEDDNPSGAAVPTDSAHVDVRLGDGTWRTVATPFGRHETWTELEVDLPTEALTDNFALGFRVTSDRTGDRLEVDMIRVRVVEGAVEPAPGRDSGGGSVSVSDAGADALASVTLSPNPATGLVTLAGRAVPDGGAHEVVVRDPLGRAVVRHPWVGGAERYVLDVAGWPAGLYVVEVRSAGRRVAVERLLVR